MDEVETTNFSFNNKTYVEVLLQKGRAKECASERVISKSVLQKKDTMR